MSKPSWVAAAVTVLGTSGGAVAFADDAGEMSANTSSSTTMTAEADSHTLEPRMFEFGIFAGGFISNYYHQFYDNNRPHEELDDVDFQFGFQVGWFPLRYAGIELEGSLILGKSKPTERYVDIFQAGGQLVGQYPLLKGHLVPFVGIGASAALTKSKGFGDDSDALLHAGGGVKYFFTDNLALRLEGRFLRGPSSKEPYDLDASYGEFHGGITYAFGARKTGETMVVPPPDPDPDRDGILGDADKCPNEAEDKDSFQDEDGCPDLDNDADGIDDLSDKCPLEAEDRDGFEDTDGCPELDNDADGVPDTTDKCPIDAEDKDSFEDEDGCPDLDNDNDGVPDATDKCPLQPETVNSYQDADGCPDEIPEQVKKFTGVIQGINFRTNSAELLNTSFRQLDKAVEVLKQFPDMVVEVQGHTDALPIKRGSKYADNLELSQARAESVATYLQSKGIEAGRLRSKGYGDTTPLVDPTGLKGGKLTTARAKNRRVEFKLVNRP